ncbi:hypothetical protein D9O50_16900 [Oxalobacteraceae bacterium CAVE-383]|nr:hypothetical protein D9O50_16900 [Oxalobacteraceae bacterium CAVE-383]
MIDKMKLLNQSFRGSTGHRKGYIMGHAINLTNAALILLDALLIWSCWAVDRHMLAKRIEK